MAGNNNYEDVTSASHAVGLHKANQGTVTVTAPSDVTFGSTGTATASGGNGTGAYSFSSTGSTGCSVLGDQGSVNDASGSCTLTATRAADDNFNVSAASAPFTVNLHKGNQAALTITNPSDATYGTPATLTSSGGTTGGTVTYSAGASTGCSVSGDQLTVTNASGTCSVTATMAGNNNYNDVTSASHLVALHKAAQGTVTATAPPDVTYGTPATATATGGSGTGAYSFSVGASTGCSVAGDQVSVINATGSCNLSATRLADNNY